MEDAIVNMLNALSGTTISGVEDLLKGPAEYNDALYSAVEAIHMAAVKPITALVLAIMFTLMLANTSTRAQGDRELGVRIIAATMFKSVLILVATQNATLILQAFNSLGSTLAGSASSIDAAGGGNTANLGDQLRDSIASAGMVKQLGMMVILLIPWLGSNVSYGGDMWEFVISNTGKFFVAPIVLIFLLFGANGMAKTVVGEG